MALGTITQTTAGSYNGTIGGGTVVFEGWGGGGGGGGASGTKSAGGGGAGGAYVKTTITVVSGTYPYIVGAGGTAGTGIGGNAGSTWFADTGSALAPGGIRGTNSTANNAGSQGGGNGTASAVGTLVFAGGIGADGVGGTGGTARAGGGGGGASDTGVGGAPTGTSTGGTGANTGGGHGGNAGGTAGAAGAAGTAIGGGGGGAFTNNTTDRAGGAGGAGKINIVYTLQESPTTALNTPADAATDQSTTPTLNFTGTDPNADSVEYNVQVSTSSFADIAFDNKGNDAERSGISSITWSYTVGAGLSNGCLFFASAVRNSTGAAYAHITGVTYNGQAMTLGKQQDGPAAARFLTAELWYLVDPPAGAHDIVVTYDRTVVDSANIGAISLQNVNQSNPIDNTAGLSTTTGNPWTQSITPIADSTWIINAIYTSSDVAINVNNSETSWFNRTTAGVDQAGGAYKGPISPAAATTTGWNNGGGGNDEGAMAIISVAPLTYLINAKSESDAGFTAGHPFASGAAKDYTVQSALANSTTYYWRARAIDPTGNNVYGAWATTRSFTTIAAGTATAGNILWRNLMGVGF